MKLAPFLLAAALLTPLASLKADGVEQIPPTPADIARELGISISKFTAKFKEPVYALFEVRILVEGGKDVTFLSQATPEPLKFHSFTLSLKDMDALAAAMGVSKTTEAKGALDVAFKHPSVGFTHRTRNPFWKMKVGQSFLNWTNPQTDKDIALGTFIPLLIQGGPYVDEAHRPKDLVTDYEKSPAYIWFGVKFSKEKPVEEEEEKK